MDELRTEPREIDGRPRRDRLDLYGVVIEIEARGKAKEADP
jgi:hypothetical protein